MCIRDRFSKALKSGLLVGVGFVGLSVVTALLTSSLGPALSQVVEIYGLQLKVFDMGWPAAAAVAYNKMCIRDRCSATAIQLQYHCKHICSNAALHLQYYCKTHAAGMQ